MAKASSILLQLLRASFDAQSYPSSVGMDLMSLSADDWEKVIDLAFDQGVSALTVDGYNHILATGADRVLETDVDSTGSPAILLETEELEDLKFEWFGSVLQAEEDYRSQWAAAVSMTDIFASEGIRTFVLKGFAVSRLYPVPEHRECGDCDIWLGDDYEKGNTLMEREGVSVSRGFYKNSSYHYKGLMVENHRFCSPIRGGRRRKAYERYLQSIIADGAVKIGNSQMWSPGPLFNALFLTSHAMGHFVNEGGITLRHVIDCDLGMKELKRTCGEQGLRIFEEKCREFGFWKFACALRDRDERLMNEILHPTVSRVEFSQGWETRLQLLRAMFGARWKYKLYTDSSFTIELLRTACAFAFERNPELDT